MTSREDLIRQSLEIEAAYLDRLGRHDEAADVRARQPIVPKITETETVEVNPSASSHVHTPPSGRKIMIWVDKNGDVRTSQTTPSVWSRMVRHAKPTPVRAVPVEELELVELPDGLFGFVTVHDDKHSE